MYNLMIDAAILNTMLGHLFLGTGDDRYEPETVGPLLAGLRGLDDESARVSIKLGAMDAEYGFPWQRN